MYFKPGGQSVESFSPSPLDTGAASGETPLSPVNSLSPASGEVVPPYIVPSPEQTAHTYELIVSKYNLPIPEGMDLGLVLARIPPDRQHTFRALHGMFPFDHALSFTELAELRGISEASVESTAVRTNRSIREGVATYQKSNPRTGVSLETLARAILKNEHNLQPYELDLLRQINGLPPYLRPLGANEISKSSRVSRAAIALRERVAAERLLGITRVLLQPASDTAPQTEPNSSTTTAYRSRRNTPSPRRQSSVIDAEQRSRLFRTRDAGWYAGMIHGLHGEETRDYWADVIRTELGRAALFRERMRKSHASQPEPLKHVLGGAALTGEKNAEPAARLAAKRAFNPEYDTPDGQERMVERLITQAEKLDPDSLPDLEAIMDEGMEAQAQLLEDNIALVFFTANRLATAKGDPSHSFNTMDLSAGYKGLREAVQRFDDSLGFTFASYATKMIAGCILKARTREAASRRSLYIKLGKIAKAEEVLSQELQRTPTDQEIAGRAGLVSAAALEKIRATALRTRPLSLDNLHDYDLTLHEAVGSVDPGFEQVEISESLASTFAEIFKECKLDNTEQTVLLSMFGIASEEKTEAQLAQELGIEEKQVLALFRRAKNKISKSAVARQLLRGYVEQVK
ncbi:MAG TPA: sigma-70 domain-containing protein [Candidatus Saccharimonadales bacterium]|nr:sigma-70 domain-containing protein [Candidatus Saccharimonadales bacterium]